MQTQRNTEYSESKNDKFVLVAAPPPLHMHHAEGVIPNYLITPEKNRYGRKIVLSGIKLDEYFLNPVCLWNHNDDLLIGKALSAEVRPEGLLMQTYYNRLTSLSKDCYALADAGDVFSFSAGFDVLEEPFEDEDGAFVFPSINLLEESLVTIPADIGARIVHGYKSNFEYRIKQAIDKGIISAESESLKYFGLQTRIKTVTQKKPMEKTTQKFSKEDVQKVQVHAADIAQSMVQHKQSLNVEGDAHDGYEQGIKQCVQALDDHKQAIEDGDEKAITQCHQAFHQALHTIRQAKLTHEHATESTKQALHIGQQGLQGLNDVMQGYPDAWSINDDVDAAVEPFEDEEPTGGGPSGNVDNVVNIGTPKGVQALKKIVVDAVKEANAPPKKDNTLSQKEMDSLFEQFNLK